MSWIEVMRDPQAHPLREGTDHLLTRLVDVRVHRRYMRYDPHPLDPPAAARVLLCCAQPETDLTLDL